MLYTGIGQFVAAYAPNATVSRSSSLSSTQPPLSLVANPLLPVFSSPLSLTLSSSVSSSRSRVFLSPSRRSRRSGGRSDAFALVVPFNSLADGSLLLLPPRRYWLYYLNPFNYLMGAMLVFPSVFSVVARDSSRSSLTLLLISSLKYGTSPSSAKTPSSASSRRHPGRPAAPIWLPF